MINIARSQEEAVPAAMTDIRNVRLLFETNSTGIDRRRYMEDVMKANERMRGSYAYVKQERAVTSAVTDIWQVRRRLETDTPPSRERSLAMTKLDEAAFWIKSIPYEKESWDDAFQLKQDLPVFGLNDFD
jgi:hypothetical protein